MLQLDHLVIAAATLADGAAWCERVFGITPAAGGKHAFMGTHNLLFSVTSARFPNAYAEIIAIDPAGGARPLGGALPTLIEWGAVHPCDALPVSGVQLDGVQLIGLDEPCLGAMGSINGVACAEPTDSAPALVATLTGPRGTLALCSLPTDPKP